MGGLKAYERLSEDKPLRAGLFRLGYDAEGVAVVTDKRTGEMRWRAGDGERGAAGRLLLGDGGAVRVENSARETVWVSDIAAPGARSLTLTKGGELELLDEHGMPVFNSRTGPTGLTPLHDAAPAADITPQRYLVRERKWRRLVTREPDGSLKISEEDQGGGGWSVHLADPLVRWLEQDGTVLTWRFLSKRWSLCLVGADGEVLWQRQPRGVPMVLPPPAAEHAYGGPELGLGGRLRHQSLTSPSGAYTLVHQEDGNLVAYDNGAHQAIWASDTEWAEDGWAELTEDGELVVRTLYGAPVWRSGTAGCGVQRLVVDDFGGAALLDADGSEVWRCGPRQDTAATGGTGDTTARGSVMRRGQTLRGQSLTSADGGTVLIHRNDGRVVLYGEDGRGVWEADTEHTAPGCLVLDDDGMLRLRAEDGSVAVELAGPGDELAVLPEEARLRRDDGTVVWRNGEQVTAPAAPTSSTSSGAPAASPSEDFTSWLDTLIDDPEPDFCVSVVHDVAPAEALRRLRVEPRQVRTGTWRELREHAQREELALDEGLIAAFPLGRHTLVVEENLGASAVDRPELSQGTFAVSFGAWYLDGCFVVRRDCEIVAGADWGGVYGELTTPEVQWALAAMGSDDMIDTAEERGVELACRTAGVRPTEADVAGPALGAIVAAP